LSKLLALLILIPTILPAQIPIPAFPGATGYGKMSSGGRGATARTMKVTNTNNSGVGSLRHAVQESTYTAIGGKPRFIIFQTSGYITLTSDIVYGADDSCMTIAFQTAPGDGIFLRGAGMIVRGDNTVVRNARIFPGDQIPPANSSANHHAITIADDPDRWIIDRSSFGWTWDNIIGLNSNTLPGASKGTVQRSIISQAFYDSPHTRNPGEGRGMSIQTASRITFYANLISETGARNPHISGGTVATPDSVVYATWVNNVMSNWRMYASRGDGNSKVDWIENYYKSGRSQQLNPKDLDLARSIISTTRYYVSGIRCSDGSDLDCADTTGLAAVGGWLTERGGTDDGWNAANSKAAGFLTDILSNVGAWPRLSMDSAIVQRVIDSTGFIPDGVQIDTLVWPICDAVYASNDTIIIAMTPYNTIGQTSAEDRWAGANHRAEVDYAVGQNEIYEIEESWQGTWDGTNRYIGLKIQSPILGAVDSVFLWTIHTDGTRVTVGYPVLDPSPRYAVTDTDLDGIPDVFETLIGSNPVVADATSDFDSDGYLNIEEYINHESLFGTSDPQVPQSTGIMLKQP